MASLASIRDGLKTRLATIAGLETYDTMPDTANPPCAIVGVPARIAYDETFRSAVARYEIPVRVFAGRVVESESQDRLDGYISPDGSTSLRAAIDGDPTLSGAAHTTRVTEARDYGVYTLGDVAYLGVEIVCEVIG